MTLLYDMAGNDVTFATVTTTGNATVGGNLTVTGTTSSSPKTVSVTAATLAPTSAQTGTMFMLNRLAGSTITLPVPVIGTRFSFYVGTVNTSVAYKIITDAATTFLTGGVYVDKSLTITRYDGDGSTHVSFNWNGTTTGGLTKGDYVTFTCIGATLWTVEGTCTASGTLATPFATS